MDFSYTKSNYCFVEKDKISPELSACPLSFSPGNTPSSGSLGRGGVGRANNRALRSEM